MTREIKILIIPGSGKTAPVMKRDYEILKKHFNAELWENFNHLNPISYLNLLKKLIKKDIIFIRFASERNLILLILSKLLGKKSILVSGGFDAVKMPEINYGLSLTKLGSSIAKSSFRLADKIVAFSDSSKNSILEIMPMADVETVYIGSVDTEIYKPKGKKEDLVVTVGHVKRNNLKRKGLETFVKAAKHLPDKDFVLIGEHKDDSIHYLKSIASPNVKFTGYLEFEDMLRYLQRAKVYVQVSAHEGFGISMANAMACECIPVVTRRYAIPEVVQDTGFYVPFDDPEETAKVIDKGLNLSDAIGRKARERIKNNFNLGVREKSLYNIVNRLI